MSTTSSPRLKAILKKPSQVLTVGIDYNPSQSSKFHNDKNEVSILSMQLRKSKISSIWCQHLDHVQDFYEEQKTAQGNFPGPVPIIYHGPILGDINHLQTIVYSGVTGIVVSLQDDRSVLDVWWNNVDGSSNNNNNDGSVELIWKVSTVDNARQVLEMTDHRADAFWLSPTKDTNDATTLFEGIVAILPKSSLIILSLDPMQPDGGEISMGKEWKQSLGCSSVVVKQVCVGDSEDIMYVQFLVNGLTSKASTEFKFTGLTGSTNGHFGGVQANNKVQWRRMEQTAK
jgi:hypothetical protein